MTMWLYALCGNIMTIKSCFT